MPHITIKSRGHVYFAQDLATGLIKIGFSTDVAARVRQLAGQYRHPVRLLGTVEGSQFTERGFHNQFRKEARGRELFLPTRRLLFRIADCAELSTMPDRFPGALYSPARLRRFNAMRADAKMRARHAREAGDHPVSMNRAQQ